MSLEDKHRQLFDALSGSTGLMAVCRGVYDDPPADAASPYVVVGDTHVVEGRLLDLTEDELYIRLHIWSRYKGRREVVSISGLLRQSLPEWAFFEDLVIMQDPEEPEWWHGVLTIRGYDR